MPANEVIVNNPATGEEIGRYSELDATALAAAIADARRAQPAWAAHSLHERIGCVRRMRDWLVDHADEAAEIISRCTGKTLMEALSFDVTPAVFGNAWYCRHASRHLAPETIPSGNRFLANKRSRLFHKPLGVIGVISPWNYPLGIPMHEIVPALLAGNTVVFKTAPETLPVGELIERMYHAAKLPDHVFRHVIVDGPVCGDVMLEKGGVDKLFFTGSVRVGKILAEKAARNLVPVSLELGGKDAMIVLDDAHIERAAAGAAWGGMQNCGQSCAGVERVYVQRSVYEEFLRAVKRQVEGLRAAGPESFDSDLGVMTTSRQVATAREHVQDALARGATEYAKAKTPFANENFIVPTVLTNVDHSMQVMREETFGPVIGVMPFDSEDQAVELANDSPYGLTASVWSRNATRAEALARRIDAGAITINDHLMSHGMTETPWGGPKDSGKGRGHGRYAFYEVTGPRVVIHDRLHFLPKNPWWFPVSKRDYEGMRGAILAAHGRGIGSRLKGLQSFLSSIGKLFQRH